MIEFKSGDLVKIYRQPPNHWVKLAGDVGVIDEILDNGYCVIQTINDWGSSVGFGSVPADCLEHETSEKWKRAKRLSGL
jgi:hypothetical protein